MNPSTLPKGVERFEGLDLPAPVIVDKEQAFLLYATFCGDLVKTAHSLGITPPQVLRMVDEGEWNQRLKPILDLKASAKPGDIERALNRALNFVQAHRFRMFLETTLQKLSGLNESDLWNLLQEAKTDKAGNVVSVKLSTRALADFAAALEKAHTMVYAALGDTTSERVKRKEGDSGTDAAGDMHARIAKAMAEVALNNSPRGQLFEAQLQQAAVAGRQDHKALVRIEEAPPSPNDSDEH